MERDGRPQALEFFAPADDAPWQPAGPGETLLQMVDDVYVQWPHIYMNQRFPAVGPSPVPPRVDYFHLRVPGDLNAVLNAVFDLRDGRGVHERRGRRRGRGEPHRGGEDQGEHDTPQGATGEGQNRYSDRTEGTHVDDFERLYKAVRMDNADALLASVEGELDQAGHIDELPTRLTSGDEQSDVVPLDVTIVRAPRKLATSVPRFQRPARRRWYCARLPPHVQRITAGILQHGHQTAITGEAPDRLRVQRRFGGEGFSGNVSTWRFRSISTRRFSGNGFGRSDGRS